MLAWHELGRLGNLAKCEKISLLGATRLQVEISDNNSVWVLFALERLIIRKLNYRMGVSEYNVLRVIRRFFLLKVYFVLKVILNWLNRETVKKIKTSSIALRSDIDSSRIQAVAFFAPRGRS